MEVFKKRLDISEYQDPQRLDSFAGVGEDADYTRDQLFRFAKS